ncbi:GNAT family N-acetyltransferase [Oleiharenicola sp. Vm1]|uniref:GNAT family N-acetyltransferase n=1 Tax=Oleiharenicola sp. Vm1 TaxID=3398393 RepID=UPI0039F4B085
MSNADGVDCPGVFLAWDSDFFGFRIGRAHSSRLTSDTLAALLAWGRGERLRCLYFFGDGNDRVTLEHAHAGGFKFIDVRVDLAVNLVRTPTPEPPAAFRPALPAELPTLETIAREAHVDSRFFKDDSFPASRAADLYARWIQRDFQEYCVFVVSGARGVAGYVTCQLDATRSVGRIGLIAVAEAERGCGRGRTLMQGALRWFRDQGCVEVRVATQASNVAAQRLYQNQGFRTADTKATYHRWF